MERVEFCSHDLLLLFSSQRTDLCCYLVIINTLLSFLFYVYVYIFIFIFIYCEFLSIQYYIFVFSIKYYVFLLFVLLNIIIVL